MFLVLLSQSFDTIAGIIFKGNGHSLSFVWNIWYVHKSQTMNITPENDTCNCIKTLE